MVESEPTTPAPLFEDIETDSTKLSMSTTLPPITIWGRPSKTEVDVFGHVPEGAEPLGVTMDSVEPLIEAKNLDIVGMTGTSTVSPMKAWDHHDDTNNDQVDSQKEITQLLQDSPFDTNTQFNSINYHDYDEISNYDVLRTDASLDSLESFSPVSSDNESNDEDMSLSYDSYQYLSPSGETDPLVADVLKDLFGDSYLDLEGLAEIQPNEIEEGKLVPNKTLDHQMPLDYDIAFTNLDESTTKHPTSVQQTLEPIEPPVYSHSFDEYKDFLEQDYSYENNYIDNTTESVDSVQVDDDVEMHVLNDDDDDINIDYTAPLLDNQASVDNAWGETIIEHNNIQDHHVDLVSNESNENILFDENDFTDSMGSLGSLEHYESEHYDYIQEVVNSIQTNMSDAFNTTMPSPTDVTTTFIDITTASTGNLSKFTYLLT